MSRLESIESVCEVEVFHGPGADSCAPADLLIEVPHGAVTEAHYESWRRQLRSNLPEDLHEFYFVNTDVGAPECAVEIARRVVGDNGAKVMVVRGIVPRTFVDLNRLEVDTGGEMTPLLPGYIDHDADVGLLRRLHADYHDLAVQAYEQVCGNGGRALTLHTYAPRTVDIRKITGNIVEQLREAYADEVYERWPRRPDVEVIGETTDGRFLASRRDVTVLRDAYARIDIELQENVTYKLHPATAGYVHSERYTEQILCVEINRSQLADPFTPFEPMRICERKVERMSGPLVEVLAGQPA